jgi:hypothetical protein
MKHGRRRASVEDAVLVKIVTHFRSQFIGYLALFIALGGTSYAVTKLPANSVTSREVKNRSLLARDFRSGQLRPGPQGPQGPQGPAGPQGPPGTADVSRLLHEDSVRRAVPRHDAKAADADALDGKDSTAFGLVAYARVKMDGTLSLQKGIASSKRIVTGQYEVRTAQPASASCVPFVTLTGGVEPLGLVSASGPAVDGTYLDVRVRNASGTAIDRPFQILLVC